MIIDKDKADMRWNTNIIVDHSCHELVDLLLKPVH